MWQILKEVTQTNPLKNDTEPQFLDQEKVNKFNSFFATVGSNIQKKLNIQEKILQKTQTEKFDFHDETEETIIKLIERIKPNVAVGHDNIHAKLLKDSKATIAKTLTQLVNISYKKSTFPNCLKKGIVKAVYKKEDPEDPSNYRPLTILSTLSKVFERSAADLSIASARPTRSSAASAFSRASLRFIFSTLVSASMTFPRALMCG